VILGMGDRDDAGFTDSVTTWRLWSIWTFLLRLSITLMISGRCRGQRPFRHLRQGRAPPDGDEHRLLPRGKMPIAVLGDILKGGLDKLKRLVWHSSADTPSTTRKLNMAFR